MMLSHMPPIPPETMQGRVDETMGGGPTQGTHITSRHVVNDPLTYGPHIRSVEPDQIMRGRPQP